MPSPKRVMLYLPQFDTIDVVSNTLDLQRDLAVRVAAFRWLTEQSAALGDVFPRSLLQKGFVFEGTQIPFVSPQGIFKPKILTLPLSITTVSGGPYADSFTIDGFLLYKYRGTDPDHPDNVGLRELMRMNRPLIYFHGIKEGQYLAIWPVYVVGDNSRDLSFKVAVDDMQSIEAPSDFDSKDTEIKRAYLTASVKIRLHQRSFRERVLDAYRSTCAFCKLRHRELLDAAHIVPDSDPAGDPKITNGIALCKIHHAAFDALMLGVTPDYQIIVRRDILDEEDGPMLQYGLKGMHKSNLILPASKIHWPDRDSLAQRYEIFRGD